MRDKNPAHANAFGSDKKKLKKKLNTDPTGDLNRRGQREHGFQCTSSFKVTVAFHSAGWTLCAFASVLLAARVEHRRDVFQLPSCLYIEAT